MQSDHWLKLVMLLSTTNQSAYFLAKRSYANLKFVYDIGSRSVLGFLLELHFR